ncbi:hypothetical protein ACFVXD_42760, partial [Kitasatospora herbaricolor]
MFGFAQPPIVDRVPSISAGVQAAVPVVEGPSGDRAVDGRSEADGYHVRVTSASDGYAWTDIAVLRPANLDPSSWYGYQCLSSDGKFAAVAVLPGDAINANSARDHGAFAYAINVATGDTKALGTGVGLKYHSPQCGLDHTAVFTSNPGVDEGSTVSTRYDLSTGKQVAQAVVAGQVTSVVPVAGTMVGAKGTDVVVLPRAGSVKDPASAKKLLAAGGAPYDLRPSSDGGVDFITFETDGRTTIRHEKDAKAENIGVGTMGSTHLFLGAGGHNIATGAKVDGSLFAADASKLPLGADNATLGGTGLFGQSRSTAPREVNAAPSQSDLASAAGAPLVELVKSRRVFQSELNEGSAKSSKRTGPTVQGYGNSPGKSATQPAPKEAKRTAYTGVGPLNPAVST